MRKTHHQRRRKNDRNQVTRSPISFSTLLARLIGQNKWQTHDFAILGLRTQILENWRYVYPDNANVVIITSFEPYPHSHKQFYNAFIAESRGQSDRIFLRLLKPSLEQALLNLLCLADVRVGSVTKDMPVESMQVRLLDQSVTKDYDRESDVRSMQPLEEKIEALKRCPQPHGHAIDLTPSH
ncbi:hypothetical protein M436DRAFT_84904 [Aureobasidium namibiae CBS 147.97]|uniref:Uncharacterized protein n=1 Tax=Aureobasidium namibiae CBS 147.97 TaxID=1043004 RepID=A0A074WAA1_9PEZI